MLDGLPANIYYSDNNAGIFPVYPLNGKRISDNKVWGLYVSSTRAGVLVIVPNRELCMAIPDCTHWKWQIDATCKEYRDDFPNGVNIGTSRCQSYIGEFNIYATDWH